jgi:hypothetical protein
MKIVKVNRNWKQWDAGHRVALRFNSYSDARDVEGIASKLFPTSGWRRDAEYYSWFGKNNGRSQYRPYFISFRDEKMLTFVLLATGLTPN